MSSGARSTSGVAPVVGGCLQTGGAGLTRYHNPGVFSLTTAADNSTTTNDAYGFVWVAPDAGTLSLLGVAPESAYDANDTCTFTVMKNAVAQSLAVTLGNSAVADTYAEDASNTVVVARGDRIGLRSVSGASGPIAGIAHNFRMIYTKT